MAQLYVYVNTYLATAAVVAVLTSSVVKVGSASYKYLLNLVKVYK